MGAIAATGRSYSCLLLPGARMRLVVYLGEVLEIKVSVDLGRRDVGVAQEFLYPPEVVARLEDVGGKRVPEQVREYICIDALPAGPVLDAGLYRPAA